MALATLSLLLALVPGLDDVASAKAREVLWSAGYETGDTSEWDGVWISGEASSEISSRARSGRYGNALTVYNANGQGATPGVRMTYTGSNLAHETDPKNLPNEAYYSAWYYVPEEVSPAWWNIFQFKEAHVDDNGVRLARALYWLGVERRDGQLHLKQATRVNSNGQWMGSSWADTLAVAPTPLPIGRWFHIESFYKWNTNGNGRLATWIDGVKVWDINNITTEFNWEYRVNKRSWTINNYTSEANPSTFTIYVDDAAVSTTRLGP